MAATEELPGGRFQVRYGEAWHKELKAECEKTHDGLKACTCVTELMDHVVAESKRAFADTPFADSFVIVAVVQRELITLIVILIITFVVSGQGKMVEGWMVFRHDAATLEALRPCCLEAKKGFE